MIKKPRTWRVLAVALVGSLLCALGQALPAEAAGGPNLAAGRSATDSGHADIYTADRITDGNPATYWESTNNAFPQWAQVDLGTTTSIDQAVLKLPPGWETRTQTLTLQGSTNGTTFTTLSAATARTFTPATTNTVTITFTATTTRYVRASITANTGWPAAQLSELEVYAAAGATTPPPTSPPPTTTPPPTGTNLALGKPITGSANFPGFTPTNATDNDTTTYFEGTTYPSTLTVALGANATLTSAVVKLNPNASWGTRTQTIQVLGRTQNTTTFTELAATRPYTFDPTTANTITIPISGTAADVRLSITTNTGAPGGQVAELQLYGTPAPNPDLTLTTTTWTPTTPVETDTITASATVKNTGTASSTSTDVNFYLGATKVGTAAVTALSSGTSATLTASIGTRAAGSYQLKAVVDEANTVVELDDSNNSWTNPTALVVAEAPGPDLQVLSIASNPANPAVGTTVTFTVAVNNRGTGAATPTVTRLSVGSATLNTNTPAIAAGATATVAVSGSWTATSGGATVTATADATNVLAETNENNNTRSQAIVVGRGAALAYTELEAEDASYQGTLVTADALRTFGHTNFGTESSGRKSVRLNSTGQFVEFTSTSPSNSVVVRNSIPDAAGGGGIEAGISLYINGTFAQKLTFSSRNSWLYGTSDDTESLSNTPSADARRLFDESHALLAQSYPAGTKFKLQRDSGDTAAFYIIDLIDLEQVAPAASKPSECTSITTYGAVANDGLDDTAAIQAAVMADQNGTISCVWIPAGQWRQEQKILTPDPARGQYNQKGIRDVVIKGAGMWHSQLYSNTEPQNVTGNINHPHEGNVGFEIEDNAQISDLAIFGMTTNRANRGHALNGRFGHDTKISNVWIEHVNVGAWVGRDYSDTPAYWNPGDGLQFTGMRIRNTYADGINFSNGTRNSRVFNSSFRTTGDDSLAIWSNQFVKDQSVDIAHDNHFVNNTVQLPWRANGVAVYGGHDNSVENNLISDTMNYPGIMLATDHSPLPFSGTTLIANNGLYRTGGAFWNEDQEFGAITLFPSTKDITGVTIRDTDISDSTYDGIQFKTGGGNMPGVVIRNVTIDKSNHGAGILAMGGARGNATLTDVTITNSATGDVVTQPGSSFTFTRN